VTDVLAAPEYKWSPRAKQPAAPIWKTWKRCRLSPVRSMTTARVQTSRGRLCSAVGCLRYLARRRIAFEKPAGLGEPRRGLPWPYRIQSSGFAEIARQTVRARRLRGGLAQEVAVVGPQPEPPCR